MANNPVLGLLKHLKGIKRYQSCVCDMENISRGERSKGNPYPKEEKCFCEAQLLIKTKFHLGHRNYLIDLLVFHDS
jgi:hypothetical protein